MEKLVIKGGRALAGTIAVSGAKNVALKALVAACLTAEKVTIHNLPLISDVFIMIEIMKELGVSVEISDHTAIIAAKEFTSHDISLEKGALARTSSMFIAPLLARVGEAIIPNPGGCRLGARPVDRTIDGVRALNADIIYHSDDGYFHAKTSGMQGTSYTFEKNTHTGTETLILAAVLAKGKTVLENAAAEPEIDELIELLTSMGANVKRSAERTIEIEGVTSLHGAEFTIQPDRNEIVTFAIAAIGTLGDVFVKDAKEYALKEFLEVLDKANGGYEIKPDGIRFYYKGELKPTNVTTMPYPGFMTDWQALWAVLMTQAVGESNIHETVFENKFGYVKDLKKMGAKIEMYNPEVDDPEEFYNFNLEDDSPEFFHAIKIHGPNKLHNAIMKTVDIRAGAAVVIAALIAQGISAIFGVEKLDRGYEDFANRLVSLGADVKRINHE